MSNFWGAVQIMLVYFIIPICKIKLDRRSHFCQAQINYHICLIGTNINNLYTSYHKRTRNDKVLLSRKHKSFRYCELTRNIKTDNLQCHQLSERGPPEKQIIIAKNKENKHFVEIYVREQTVIPILRRNSVIQKGIQLWEKNTKMQLLPQQNAAQNHHRTENQWTESK